MFPLWRFVGQGRKSVPFRMLCQPKFHPWKAYNTATTPSTPDVQTTSNEGEKESQKTQDLKSESNLKIEPKKEDVGIPKDNDPPAFNVKTKGSKLKKRSLKGEVDEPAVSDAQSDVKELKGLNDNSIANINAKLDLLISEMRKLSASLALAMPPERLQKKPAFPSKAPVFEFPDVPEGPPPSRNFGGGGPPFGGGGPPFGGRRFDRPKGGYGGFNKKFQPRRETLDDFEEEEFPHPKASGPDSKSIPPEERGFSRPGKQPTRAGDQVEGDEDEGEDKGFQRRQTRGGGRNVRYEDSKFGGSGGGGGKFGGGRPPFPPRR